MLRATSMLPCSRRGRNRTAERNRAAETAKARAAAWQSLARRVASDRRASGMARHDARELWKLLTYEPHRPLAPNQYRRLACYVTRYLPRDGHAAGEVSA